MGRACIEIDILEGKAMKNDRNLCFCFSRFQHGASLIASKMSRIKCSFAIGFGTNACAPD